MVVIVARVGELVFTTMLLPSIAATPAEARLMVVSEAAPNSIVPKVTAVEVPTPKVVIPAKVMSLPVWVIVASPLSQLMTPPSARNRSEKRFVVALPNAAPSSAVGTILVVMVGDVSTHAEAVEAPTNVLAASIRARVAVVEGNVYVCPAVPV